MAGRIPEIQRKKLASSAVGVVGADNSMAKAIYHTAGVMKDVQKQNEKRDSAEAKSRLSLAAVDYRRDVSRIQRDESLSEDDYNLAMDSLREDHRSKLDERDRSAFDTYAADVIIKKGEEFYKIKENRKLKKAAGNLRAGDDIAANELSEMIREDSEFMSFDEFLLSFSNVVDGRQQAYDNQVDDFGAKAIDDAKRESKYLIAESVVKDLIEEKPEAVGEFLDAMTDSGIFNTKEENDLRSQAIKMKDAQDKQKELLNARAGYDLAQEWAALPHDKLPSWYQIDRAAAAKLISPSVAKAYKDAKVSGSMEYIGDNPAGYDKLMVLVQNVATAEDKKDEWGWGRRSKADTEGREQAFYAASAQAQQAILESMELGPSRGGIGQADAKKLLKAMTKSYSENIEDIYKTVRTRMSQHSETADFAYQMDFKDEEMTLRARYLLSTQYLQTIDKEEDRLNRDLTEAETIAVRDNVIKTFSRSLRPAYYTVGDIVQGPKGPLQLVRFKPNGGMVWNDEINPALQPKDDDLKVPR